MIRYRYYDSDGIASITRDEIIEEYWDIWIKKMKRLHGDTYDSFTKMIVFMIGANKMLHG